MFYIYGSVWGIPTYSLPTLWYLSYYQLIKSATISNSYNLSMTCYNSTTAIISLYGFSLTPKLLCLHMYGNPILQNQIVTCTDEQGVKNQFCLLSAQGSLARHLSDSKAQQICQNCRKTGFTFGKVHKRHKTLHFVDHTYQQYITTHSRPRAFYSCVHPAEVGHHFPKLLSCMVIFLLTQWVDLGGVGVYCSQCQTLSNQRGYPGHYTCTCM